MWENVKGLLALPEDPNQRAAAKQGLLGFGATLLGGRGDLGGILGDGVMAGSQGYSAALQQQQQQQLMATQQKRWELENRETQAKLDEPMAIAALLGPGAGGGGSSAASTQMSATATPSAPAGPAAGFGQPRPPEQQYAQLMDYANRLTQSGRVAQAKLYYDMAEKLRPKLKEQRALTVDGKRVVANVFEDGTTQQLDGFAPDLEKLNFQNTGGSTVALDPYTGKPVNTIQNTVSPDARLSADTARRGQDMADRRAHEANMAPEYKQDTDGTWLALPKKVLAGQPVRAAQVFGPDGKPLAAAPKPLTETQGKATTFAARMTDAEQTINELEADGVSGNDYSTIAAGSPWTNWAASSRGQRYRQAQENWVTANLRQESGAAIPRDEMEKDIRKFFPAVGDGPAVRAQKAQARAVATQGMIVQAGPGARKVDGIVTKARELKDLPKKPTPSGHPADISNLLNKYGAK